jgi:hypothetical protein
MKYLLNRKLFELYLIKKLEIIHCLINLKPLFEPITSCHQGKDDEKINWK